MFDINDEMINQLNAERQAAYPLREFIPIDYSQYSTDATGGLDTPEVIRERINALQAQQQQPQQVGGGDSVYSQYGINYDVNGDGKVGLFEGMSIAGLGNNIASFVKEAGTGLTYLGTHPEAISEMTQEYYNDIYYKGQNTFGNRLGLPYNNFTSPIITGGYAIGDFINSVAHPYSLDSETIKKNIGDLASGKATIGDIASRVTHRGYEQGGAIGLDALTAGSGKLLKGITKAGKAATKAQSSIAANTAKIAQKTEKIRSAGKGVINNKSGVSPAALVKAAETGNWKGIPTEAKNTIKKYSDVVNDTIKEYSPSTWVEPEEISIIQKYVRDNGVTYQQAERILKPILDEAKDVVVVKRGYHYSPNTNIKKFSDDFVGDFSGRADHGHGLYVSTIEDTAKGFTRIFDEQTSKAGKLYEIKVPEDNLLLRESLPLSQQSEFVQNVITKLAKDNDNLAKAMLDDATGSELYRAISGDARTASKLLDNNGVKGIKYYEGLPSEGISIFNPSKNASIISEGVKGRKSLNLDTLAKLAKDDAIAKQVYESKKLFDKGDIFPITHGLAEVDKAARVDELGRIMAGRFSTRAFGNATYADIAKQIANPNDYISQLTKNYLDESIRKVLKDGYSGDINIRPINPKDAMYVSREAIENSGSSLKNALETASTTPLRPDDIAVDKDFLKSFRDQYALQQTNNPYGRTPSGDLYNLRKSTALASGGYLVGNLQTGLANAIVNSNAGLIDDVINATLTKGKLAKNLGLYRRDTLRNTNITPLGRALQNANLYTGGYLLQKADSKMQNMFAEIAAHSELRKQGVPSRNRLSTIQNLEGEKLGNLINDVKLISLINPTKSIAPRELAGIGGVFNPFWRWVDTAAQSSLFMLNRHPILANAVLFDVLAKAGYDREMQNRLGINVELDRPFVSYKVNPKTGEAREMSMEFLPQMNTLKFSSELVDSLKGKGDLVNVSTASIPVIGAAILASRGLNKYGKPMYRDSKSMYDSISVVGGKRYKLNPKTGMPELEGGHLDEAISAIANETIGGINLFNRTIAPSVASGMSKVTGEDYDYYLPYGQALFGSFAKRGQAPTERIPFLVAGDPTRPRGEQEIGNMLRGIYEAPYYPSSKIEQGIYNPSLLRGFYKGLNRRDMREMNTLMNR